MDKCTPITSSTAKSSNRDVGLPVYQHSLSALPCRSRALYFGVFVNVINNLMLIHCFLMMGSVLSNDSPLILIIIGNVLRLLGLNLLYGSGDEIRTFTTERISKCRTMQDLHYMGHTLSALLLSPSSPLEFYLLNGRRYRA